MKVKIKKLTRDARLPYKKYDSDFCFDVYATSCVQLADNTYEYGTGLSMQIERGEEEVLILGNEHYKNRISIDTSKMPLKFSIDLRPRSSVWRTGMMLSNGVGTIDEGYTGEIKAVFYHINTDFPRYKVGDRIGQIKIGFTLPIEFEFANELNETSRNDKGYGSTGR